MDLHRSKISGGKDEETAGAGSASSALRAANRNDATGDGNERTLLGRGRGAIVHAVLHSSGERIAVKTFVGSGLARAVHTLVFGADNPYVWDRTAMAEAHHRRRLLAQLVPFWTNGRARVARSLGAAWDDAEKVNTLSMELIEGRGAALRQPFSKREEDEKSELVSCVMKPLQRSLVAAGFDGSAWQAGLHNPVAASNFMRDLKSSEGPRWVWIDVESGVPALFPANPLGLLTYYIPRAFKFGRPLFDDVDIAALGDYLAAHETAIRASLGEAGWRELNDAAAALAEAQSRSRWRSLGRIGRGIEARLSRGRIAEDEAAWFRKHPLRFMLSEVGRATSGLARRAIRWARAWLRPRLLFGFFLEAVRLVASGKRREAFARRYVAAHIERWRRRRQISSDQFDELMRELHAAESSVYLTDFGMHLAIKPFVKTMTWGVLPILFGLGVIDEATLALGVVGGGTIGRTLYSSYRVAESALQGRRAPWAALFVGLAPVIGNVAFPIQILADGLSREEKMARFIVYGVVSRLGEWLPIWGGSDTLAEHGFNRLADLVFSGRKRG